MIRVGNVQLRLIGVFIITFIAASIFINIEWSPPFFKTIQLDLSPDQISHLKYLNNLKQVRQNEDKMCLWNTRLLIAMDHSYIGLFQNFWLNSLTPFNLTGCLRVYCLDLKIAAILALNYNLTCEFVNVSRVATSVTPSGLVFSIDSAIEGLLRNESFHIATRAPVFDTLPYAQQTYGKFFALAHAIRLNRSIFLTDVDVKYLKNPLVTLEADCPASKHDFCIQNNTSDNLNTGIYLARPTPTVIDMFNTVVAAILSNPRQGPVLDDQKIFNSVVPAFKSGIRLHVLPVERYRVGAGLFGQLDFQELKDVVLIHFNFLVGLRNKIFMMKEYLGWSLDTNKYYSCTNCRYLTYIPSNPTNPKVLKKELSSAFILAYILRRILILPAFPCPRSSQLNSSCTAQRHFNIDKLDHYLLDLYREHAFPRNPLTPPLSEEKVGIQKFIGINGEPQLEDLARFSESSKARLLIIQRLKEFNLEKIAHSKLLPPSEFISNVGRAVSVVS